MSQEEIQKYDSGFNEGFLYAVQLTTSEMLRLINNHPNWMLKPDKAQAVACFKMAARRILQHRGLVPSTYDVMMGKADDVKLDFNMEQKKRFK